MSETKIDKQCYDALLYEANRFAKETKIKGLTSKDLLRLMVESVKRKMKIINTYEKAKAKS